MDKPKCEYHFHIPNVGVCCEYYSKTFDEYGRTWLHFPKCEEENCPLKHPELLMGRKLESEIESKCTPLRFIPRSERDGKLCYFCGTNLSVKYICEVDMPAKAPEPFKVNACNKCALIKIR